MQPSSSIHWNSYPALLAAGLIAAGVLVARLAGLPPWLWMFAAGVSIIGAVASQRQTKLVGTTALLPCVVLSVFATGGLRYLEHRAPAASDISLLPTGAEVRLIGRPTNAAGTRTGIRFVLDVESAAVEGHRLAVDGRVQVYVRGESIDAVSPCRRLAVDGRLAALPRRKNPADFDYAAYLGGHHVFSRLFADGFSELTQNELATSPGGKQGIACFAYRIRQTVEERLRRSVPHDAARSIIMALVVGDRSKIDDETQARFRRTGLLHLLAVSGLHVLIVGMILYQLLRPVLLRTGMSWLAAEYTRTAGTAFVLVVYALVTGLPASVVRAVVMAVLFMVGTTFQRSSQSLNTLGVAVLVLLLWRPGQLFEPGFQLSVAAVAAIITLQRRFASLFGSWGESGGFSGFLRSSASVSMAASAGTLPVLLSHFGSVSFAGLFLNIVAVPLTSSTLAAAVTTAIAAGFSEAMGGTFGFAAQFFARSLLFVVEYGEPYFRWAYFEVRVEDAPVIAAIIAAVSMAAQWPRPHLRWRLCAAALAFVAVDMVCDAAAGEWRADLDIVFLDVGQGDAALLTFPNGRTLLVDTGPRTATFDAGRRVILPHLEHRRIRRLDAVLVTHPDSDHLGGLPTVLRSVVVDRVLHSGRPHDSALYSETLRLLDSLRVPFESVRAGDTLAIDPSVRIQVLHPDRPLTADSPNASSVVLHVRYRDTAVMLLGDAEREAEWYVVRRYGDSAASEVVKIGHHGSKTSSTDLLLSRVVQSGTIAVISAGERNRFGHPDSLVIRRLRARGAVIHRTDVHGAVHVRSNGHVARVQRWK